MYAPLDTIAIERGLPHASVLRGREYWHEGRVRQVRPEPATGLIHGVVEGTDTYEQRIAVKPERHRTLIEGVCSCPVGFNCKHVAAVLFALAGARPGAPRPPDRAGERSTARTEERDSQPLSHSPASVDRGPAPLPASLERWLDAIEVTHAGEQSDADPDTHYPPGTLQRLLYIFGPAEGRAYGRATELRLATARILKTGGYSGAQSYQAAGTAILVPPPFVSTADVRILRSLLLHARDLGNGTVLFNGEDAADVLIKIAATGRAHWNTVQSRVLRLGQPRQATTEWAFNDKGMQNIEFRCERAITAVVATAPPWYIDADSGELGPLETPLPPRLAATLATAPAVPPQHATRFAEALAARVSARQMPRPAPVREAPAEQVAPVPVLRVGSRDMGERWLSRGRTAWTIDHASLEFDYRGVRAGGNAAPTVPVFENGVVRTLKRDYAAEKRAAEALQHAGFVKIKDVEVVFCPDDLREAYTHTSEANWLAFMALGTRTLRAAGWRVEIDPGFRFDVIEPDDWFADVAERGNEWFDVELGIEIGKERISLARLLPQLVAQHPRLRDADWLARAEPGTAVHVKLADARVIRLRIDRLRPILSVFHELVDGETDALHLSRLDAPRLTALAAGMPIDLRGAKALTAFSERLSTFGGIESIAPPRGLVLELRQYQLRGLAWLQFLREYSLAGILADDMGLGKTVQTLAHILVEKEAGRLDRPALIIAPTSLVHNWRAEAERFAPGLRVLALRGPERARDFARIPDHDVVITTYPLLSRDKDVLGGYGFHLVILDEAQNIKNATTRAAQVVRELDARHRLCLTGTPLENHLGELWSLFHFLLPGFLGDERSFKRIYRTPIEKEGNSLRREQLARRVRPFLLRRTKAEVASELPPKTEIIRTVELAGAQRDLYESVRVTVDRAVRAEIERVGLAKSQIAILDALLKLRQVCCDPRLVKMTAARLVAESAKLALLAEMVPKLIEEGRRILIFSQFTSMLALIEEKLHELGIDYVLLTGDTRDRERPVKRFQALEVPVFLISLKAGGTGLNLTAADTVIHYDPWWNPAVETQATDRAHRIGQLQPVFVYKLIVAGSVEERIVEMQHRKADIASAILAGTDLAATKLTQADLAALFDPIEDAPGV